MNSLESIRFNIINLEEIDSTNIYASQLINENKATEGTVIVAKNQISGKGQAESKWESKPGENLTFSIIFCPTFLPVANQFSLSKSISLAIIDFLRTLGIKKIYIKWPNDIYVGDKKIAGILIENRIIGTEYKVAIVGLGININQTVFSSNIPNPTSLRIILNKELNISNCLNSILNSLNKRYRLLKTKDYQQIDKDYLLSLYKLNQWATYSYQSENIIAKITGVNLYGKLILEKENKEKIECDLKEIKYMH